MKAYVTLLSTPNYLDGVLVLALSLKLQETCVSCSDGIAGFLRL